MLTQAELIAKYNNDCRPKFNDEFFIKRDEDIIEELKTVILSCQRDGTSVIKVVDFRVVDDYFEIQNILRKYEASSSKSKSKTSSKRKENFYDYINLKDSAIKLLVVKYFIAIKGVSEYIDVYIAIPRIVNKFYLKLAGSIYSAMFQIVEASTYNNTTSTNVKNHRIVLRTILGSVNLYRKIVDIKTTEGNVLKCTYYLANVFSKSLPAMKYLLAKYGYYGTLQKFGIPSYVIKISDIDPKNEQFYTFQKKDDFFISIPKMLFDKEPILQSLVYTIYQAVIRATQVNDIFDQAFWLKSLGLNFNNDSIEKGYAVLESIANIYDIKTHKLIRLPEEKKSDIFGLLQWMMCEFSNLRAKDNLDLATKRIRFAEYCAAIYATKLSRGIYRIADIGNRADIDTIRKAITIAPMYLIEEMQNSKLVNYRDMVNDSDSFAALKYTYKGIAGIGEKSSNSVPDIFKMVNASHLGRVDLNASSNSDPGLSGILCPLGRAYNDGFFDDFEEPMFWEKEFAELMDNYKKMIGLKEIYQLKKSLNIKQDKSEEDLNGLIKIYQRLIPNPARFEGQIEAGLPLEDSGNIRYRND